jgi:pimeloyl-ACP methyl ester carboxylesterase
MSKQRTWQSWVWFFTARGALIYLALILLAALLQRHLIYFPSKAREEELLRQAEIDGLHPWRDSGNRLIGWRSSSPDTRLLPRNRLVVFHGNAGYALHRSYYVNGFQGIPEGETTWEVFLFEYPGYGARPGSPSEENIIASAREAMKDLKNDSRPIYLLGESLGSSFASRLAAENPKAISGLFLVTPLTCMADVAASHYRFLPVRLILREHHDVQSHLKAFPGPAAFLLAGRDEVIPDNLGEKLYRQYSGRKKRWIQPEAGHNTLDFSEGAPLWQEVVDFWK